MRACALLAILTACSLGGKRPNYQYYVLTSTQAQPRSPSAASQPRTLAVTHVSIPRYLDREQIATRPGGSQVVYSRTDRWAEPLDEAFARTLRENLATRLSTIAIQEYEGESTYALEVEVLRFERSGADQVELWARWSLRSDAEIVDRGETRMRIPVQGSTSNAAALALSETIARMATDIAMHVRKADVIATRSQHRP